MGGDGCPRDNAKALYMYPVLSTQNKAKELDQKICFKQGTSYKATIEFKNNDGGGDGETLIDSVRDVSKSLEYPGTIERGTKTFFRNLFLFFNPTTTDFIKNHSYSIIRFILFIQSVSHYISH